jgi:hypothetical protein
VKITRPAYFAGGCPYRREHFRYLIDAPGSGTESDSLFLSLSFSAVERDRSVVLVPHELKVAVNRPGIDVEVPRQRLVGRPFFALAAPGRSPASAARTAACQDTASSSPWIAGLPRRRCSTVPDAVVSCQWSVVRRQTLGRACFPHLERGTRGDVRHPPSGRVGHALWDVRHTPSGSVGHALSVFEMTGCPGFARNQRATAEWI